MLGIASRFTPWGRPFQPYDIAVVVSDPNDLTGLNPEEGTPFNGPAFVLTNNGRDVVTYVSSLSVSAVSNIVTDVITNATGTLQHGQSVTVTPQFYTQNAGAFTVNARLNFRLTAYSEEAWLLHNSNDLNLLETNPVYKVSRSAIGSQDVLISGSAYADN